jgi:tetratricopeptide (TPR) repeat protein
MMSLENELLNQGVERLQAGDCEAALNLLDQAIAENPEQPDAWYQKGLVLQKLGCYVEAVKANQKFSTLTRALKRSDKISKKLKPSQSVKTSKNSDVALEWFEQGTQEFLSGNFEGALTNYDKGLEIQPENPEVWYARGIVLHYLNDYGEAIASFDKARAINPNDHNVWNMRGVSLSHFNRYEEAISSFDQALKITSDDYQSWFNRGITLCDYLARYEEAITSFNKVLKVKPDYYEAWYNRGVSLSHLSLYEEAIASYDKALELNPSFHNAWYNRGNAVLSSPMYSRLPASVVGVILSQRNPQLNQRGYSGQVITLEFGLTQVALHSEGWGSLHLGLGEAHFGQGKLEQQLGHDPSPYWQKARHCLDLALSVLSVEAFPELRLEALELMTRVLWVQGDNSTAQTYLKASSTLLHTLLNQAPTILQKQQLEAKFSGVSQIAVDVWLQAGEPITALETAEHFKNRCLTWILDAWKETVIYPSYADMQTLCTPDTAIIYWHLSSDNLSTFLLADKTNAPGILESNKTSQARPNSLSTFLMTDKGNVPDILDFNRTLQAQQLTEQATVITSAPPNILTLEETAAYLLLSPATVAQRALQGDIPGQHIDNTWHFLKPEIDRWQQTQDKRAILLKQAGALADDDTLENLQSEIDHARQQLTFEADNP